MRGRAVRIGIVALALCTGLGLILGGSADAKKKHKKSKVAVFQQSLSPNLAIPEDNPSGASTPVKSSLTVSGKKFKGKVVGDLDVTGIQTTGSAAGAARDLRLKLIAPNGRTIYLIGRSLGDVSIGPLTIDADSPVTVCDADTLDTCSEPGPTLIRPFAGTAGSEGLGGMSSGGVRAMDGIAMTGTWTIEAWDQTTAGAKTSVLNTWGLKITSAKPIT
jgi:subtilisin-like proprotein convertase family protein